jgi:hypothetical protein
VCSSDLDACNLYSRDNNGFLHETEQWPSGLKALGDYLHGKGLKFNLYTDIGSWGCGGGVATISGVEGYEDMDARQVMGPSAVYYFPRIFISSIYLIRVRQGARYQTLKIAVGN